MLGATLILKYVTRGYPKVLAEYDHDALSSEMQGILHYLRDVEMVKHSQDEHTVAVLVEQNKLCWEHVPTWMRSSQEVGASCVLTSCLKGVG